MKNNSFGQQTEHCLQKTKPQCDLIASIYALRLGNLINMAQTRPH
jgi:hypothetical protein